MPSTNVPQPPAETPRRNVPIEAFISYAHKDEALRQALDEHLALLKSRRFIDAWHDRRIAPGGDWAHDIDTHLASARLILLLVTPAFFASGYCTGVEMKRALARERRGEASVIPIIMKEGDYAGAPFSHLKELPTDGLASGRSVAGKKWKNRDEALREVTIGIRTHLEELQSRRLVKHAVRIYQDKAKRRPSREDRLEIGGLAASFGRIIAGRRVLWVDDNPKNNEVECAAFAELGIDVKTATDTKGALTCLRASSYDAVVSDWTRHPSVAPDVSEGLRLLRTMRRRSDRTPLVFYVGWTSPKELAQRRTLAAEAGATGVTASPRELLRWCVGELVRSAALDPRAPFVELPLYP